ncbi:hypothetical protein QJQ45_006511 [Haematococcus lacustris]|nr:hypothetical protein QJQ45_006511 [Haematococcus lacustris]
MVKEKPAAAAPPGTSEDAAQLLKEVAAYASELGLGTGVGIADAFDDFAPHKAKQPLATAAKVKLSASERKPVAETAVSGGKQSTQQARNVSPPAEVKQAPEREWNFGVGPRPGEQHGKSLLGKSDPTIWFEAAAALPPLPASDQPISDEDVERLRQQGEQMLANEAASFEREMQKRNAADYKWLQQVKRQGTTADKVAAITLQVQESAVANLAGLDMLLGWVTRRQGGREVVRQALEALQELFLTVLLPDGRRLKHLESQPLASLPSGKEGAKYLLWWFLEDQIKVRYGLFVGALEECSRDNLEFLKDKATKALYTLLVKKPEAEARLLGALVNKLGDPARKLASKAGYLLSQLLLQHPVMKPVVLRELERFVFRPGLQDRARYYAVVFMNQLPLNRKESEGGASLAGKLVGLYFTLFRMVVEGSIGLAAATRKLQVAAMNVCGYAAGGVFRHLEERYSKERATYLRAKQRQQQQMTSRRSNSGTGTTAGMGMKDRERQRPVKPPKKPDLAVPEEMDARLLSALITGIRRAFPFVAPEEVEPLVEANCQRLFTLMHTAPFPVAVQALMLMWQLMSSKSAVTDRFYRALYSVMSNEAALTSSKAPMFLSLLFKAMRVDVSTKRCAAFSKRLLQTAVLAPPAFACGSLLLVSEVLKAQPALWAGVLQPEDLAVPITTTDTATSLHTSHVDHNHPTGNSLGTSRYPGQGNGKPGGRHSRQGARAVPLPLLADDGEEVFRDVESSEEGEGLLQGPGSEGAAGRQPVSLRVRRGKPLQASSGHEGQQVALQVATPQAGEGGQQGPGSSAEGWPRVGCYDMSKREPQYAGAERSCWWELAALAAHSHPSVAAMARTLLAGQCVVYDGDPLKDMALAAFLDNCMPDALDVKIAVKAAALYCLQAQARGASLMQPITAADPELHPQTELGSVANARPSSAGPGSEAFAALAESQVQPDDVFFHRFYTLQTVKARRAAAKTAKAAKRAKQGKGSDDDASSDDGKELGSEDEAEADALLEKEEGGVDDKLGDPDVGYDYDQLVSIMAEDSSKGPGSDEDGEEAVEEGEDGVEEGEEEEEQEEGEEADEETDQAEEENDDWVMASHEAITAGCQGDAGKQPEPGKGKRGRRGAGSQSEGEAEIDAMDLATIMSLPSPSSSEASLLDSPATGSGSEGEGAGGGSSDIEDMFFREDEEQEEEEEEEGSGGARLVSAKRRAAALPDMSVGLGGPEGKRAKQPKGRKGGPLLASAEAYQAMIDQIEAATAHAQPAADGECNAGHGVGKSVAPRKPVQAPCSSQAATQPAASEPGPNTPQPAKHSKAEQAAEPTRPTKGGGKADSKAAETEPDPQPGQGVDRDCNAALNMQRIGESRWRSLELCCWPEQAALPAKGKEYPGLRYKLLRDKPPKVRQQPAEAQ